MVVWLVLSSVCLGTWIDCIVNKNTYIVEIFW